MKNQFKILTLTTFLAVSFAFTLQYTYAARTYAKILGHKEAVKTLQTTLDEEAATDKKLTVIAEKLNLLPQEEAALKN